VKQKSRLIDHNFVLAVYVLFGMCVTILLVIQHEVSLVVILVYLLEWVGRVADAWVEYSRCRPP